MKPRKPGTVFLERALSKLGVASRSQAREWIQEGRISFQNKICRNPHFLVCPEKETFQLDGKDLKIFSKTTFLLHKPTGLVTTRSDEKGRPTIFSLLPSLKMNLHSVGRLDMASSGLLLLTNDTHFSSWLTDPKNQIVRTYVVTVRGFVSEKEVKEISSQVKEIILRKTSFKESHLTVSLTQGKNREIRNLFQNLDHKVTRLKRISFGGLNLGTLQPGQYREVPLPELKKTFPTYFLNPMQIHKKEKM